MMLRITFLITTICVLFADATESQAPSISHHHDHDHHGRNYTTRGPFRPTVTMTRTTSRVATLTASPGSNTVPTNNTHTTMFPTRPYEGAIRLVNGSADNEGRVEVYSEGQWGTVCDWDWDVADAEVACRQLGFTAGGAPVQPRSFFGPGNGTISMSGVDCSGYENRLQDCFDYYGSCDHGEDVGVTCFDNTPTTSPPFHDKWFDVFLVNGYEAYQGAVLVSVNGGEQWGGVCNIYDNFAQAICNELGYRSTSYDAEALYISTALTAYPHVIDSASCNGFESDISDCYITPAVNGTCRYYGNNAVRCNPNIYVYGITRHIKMIIIISSSVALSIVLILSIAACCCCCCRKNRNKVVAVHTPMPAPTPAPIRVGVYMPIHETKVPIDQAHSTIA